MSAAHFCSRCGARVVTPGACVDCGGVALAPTPIVHVLVPVAPVAPVAPPALTTKPAHQKTTKSP